MKLDSYLSLHSKLTSKWSKNFSRWYDTIESGSGTRKGYTWSHWYRKGFLERTLIELVLSLAINKWDLKKSKCFCTTKDIIILMKGQSTKLKMSTMYTSDNWSLSRIYKELTSGIIKKENKTEMGHESKQRVLKRQMQIAVKPFKIFNIINYQGNTN